MWSNVWKPSHFLTLAVVVLAPLPFGSVATIWILIWCFLLGIALAVSSLRPIRRVHLGLLAPVLAVALLFGAVVWLQMQSPPLLGHPSPIWSQVEEVLGAPVAQRVAVSVPAPWMSLGVPLAMLLAFLCGFLNSLESRNAATLVRTVAISGAAFAVYGILSLVVDPAALLWSQKTAYLGTVTGTFVNRNTAATYFGTCAILWLSIGWTELEKHLSAGRTGLAEVAAMLAQRPALKLVIAAAGFMVCLVALVLTLSRAGTLLSLSALAITAGLLGHRRLARVRRPLWAIGLAGVAGGLLFEFLGGGVAYRIGTAGLVDPGRVEAYRSTLALIQDYPLLGTGLGTFPAVFQAYRSFETGTTFIWNHAHSTPLEVAAELGLPVAIAMTALCIFLLANLVRGSLIRRRDAMFPAAAVGVCFLGLAHSTVDFSLLIPGYAIVFSALVGCGLAQSVRSGPPQKTPSRSRVENEETAGVAAPRAEPVV